PVHGDVAQRGGERGAESAALHGRVENPADLGLLPGGLLAHVGLGPGVLPLDLPRGDDPIIQEADDAGVEGAVPPLLMVGEGGLRVVVHSCTSGRRYQGHTASASSLRPRRRVSRSVCSGQSSSSRVRVIAPGYAGSEGRWAVAVAGVESGRSGIVGAAAGVRSGPVLQEMLAPALLLDRVESLLRRFVERAAVQERLELEIGLVLLPGAAELLAELAGDEVAVGPGVADGELADPPPGHTGGLVPDRVEEARGLHAVVAAAEAVQVLDRGGAAAGGVLEVELLDVVALADGHDVAVAAGDGADGV